MRTIGGDESLGLRSQERMILPYLEKTLDLALPWLASIDLDETSCVTRLNKDQINKILELCSRTEKRIALLYTHMNQFNLAEPHFQKALSYGRRYDREEEMRTELFIYDLWRASIKSR